MRDEEDTHYAEPRPLIESPAPEPKGFEEAPKVPEEAFRMVKELMDETNALTRAPVPLKSEPKGDSVQERVERVLARKGLHGKHCGRWIVAEKRYCDEPATVCNGGYFCAEHDPYVLHAEPKRESEPIKCVLCGDTFVDHYSLGSRKVCYNKDENSISLITGNYFTPPAQPAPEKAAPSKDRFDQMDDDLMAACAEKADEIEFPSRPRSKTYPAHGSGFLVYFDYNETALYIRAIEASLATAQERIKEVEKEDKELVDLRWWKNHASGLVQKEQEIRGRVLMAIELVTENPSDGLRQLQLIRDAIPASRAVSHSTSAESELSTLKQKIAAEIDKAESRFGSEVVQDILDRLKALIGEPDAHIS